MDLTLQNILEDYWNQTLLLLTAFGILLRMVFNFTLKKKEISHGINHKSRMEALIRFFNAYAEVKSMWDKLPIYNICKNELSSKEIDGLIQPPLNRLEASVMELQLYFDEEIHGKFKLIERNTYKLNSEFMNIALGTSIDKSLTRKANDYTSCKEDIEKENTNIIKEINLKIRNKVS